MGDLAERKDTGVTTYERKFTKEQIEMIKKTIVPSDAQVPEINWFLGQAKRTGLDPLGKQIYLMIFKSGGQRRPVVHIGIDGYLLIANRSGAYAGMDDAIYGPMIPDKYMDEPFERPEWCKITTYKIVQGVRVPFTSTCYWDEFYPGGSRGFKWRSSPRHMLAKCTKGQVLRTAFPKEFAGTYTTAEIDKMQSEEARQGAEFIRKFMASIPEEITSLLDSEEVSHKERIGLFKQLNFDISEIEKAFKFLGELKDEEILTRLKEKGLTHSILMAKESEYDIEKLTAALAPFQEETKE